MLGAEYAINSKDPRAYGGSRSDVPAWARPVQMPTGASKLRLSFSRRLEMIYIDYELGRQYQLDRQRDADARRLLSDASATRRTHAPILAAFREGARAALRLRQSASLIVLRRAW